MRLPYFLLRWLLPCVAAAGNADAGRKTFETVCAGCHGASGSPDPDSPIVKAFDPAPADLSDPLFNSREPASDWFMVVKYGGAALGLSAQMPAHEAALTDAQIEDVVAYVKTLTDTAPYPPGELNLMLPVRTKKAFPEDEVVWKSRYESRDGKDVFRNVFEYEKRVGKAGQAIVEIVQSDDGTDSDIREVEIGYKHAFAFDRARLSLWSAAVVLAIPVDGDGDEEIVPYVAHARQLSDSFTWQGSARAKLPVGNLDDGELELAGVVHYTWSPWPRRLYPALAATATVPFEDNGGDRVQFTVLPQVRVGLTRGGHVALNLGVELPLSDQSWDARYHLTLLWDFADGGFFKGW